ncbi:MAG: 3-oxoacyl-ACP reductase FabG [Pseudomonadales bacterium]|jgi:3-oxoacyl-[acyl-carrier protein] reductase
MSIEGKIALVTGATRGIGKAIALELASQGATVIGTATSESGAEQIKTALAEAGNPGTGIVMDVASQESIDAAIAQINEQFGAPTILVNNAGITRDNIMLRMKDDEWDAVINTNLSSIYRVSKALLRGMTKARWGRIINISSVVGSMGNAGQCNYSAAKAGVEGFTRSLAREVGSRGITVNSVAPGFIDTDMTKELSDEHKAAMLSAVPVQRLGQPEEISAAVGYLASEAAGYVTGETLHVNGGMYM